MHLLRRERLNQLLEKTLKNPRTQENNEGTWLAGIHQELGRKNTKKIEKKHDYAQVGSQGKC